MDDIQSSDFHVDYSDVHRHWHPASEKFAGADAFLTAIQDGWRLVGSVYSEEIWHGGSRLVVLFHATLERGDETMDMPVFSNPWIRRQLGRNRLDIRPLAERAQQRNRASA